VVGRGLVHLVETLKEIHFPDPPCVKHVWQGMTNDEQPDPAARITGGRTDVALDA